MSVEAWPLDDGEEPRHFTVAERLHPPANLDVVPVPPNSQTLITSAVGPEGPRPGGGADAGEDTGASPTSRPAPATRPTEEAPPPVEPEQRPCLVLFPDITAACRESITYVGHCVFLRNTVRGLEAVHHLRVLVLNREPETLLVPLSSVRLLSLGGPLKVSVMLDDEGKPTNRLAVPPGEEARAHIFFLEPPPLSTELRVEWRVWIGSRRAVERRFERRIARRFVVSEPVFTEVERLGACYDEPPPPTPSEWMDTGLEPTPELVGEGEGGTAGPP